MKAYIVNKNFDKLDTVKIKVLRHKFTKTRESHNMGEIFRRKILNKNFLSKNLPNLYNALMEIRTSVLKNCPKIQTFNQKLFWNYNDHFFSIGNCYAWSEWQYQVLTRIWSNWNLCVHLRGCKVAQLLLENWQYHLQ